MRAWLRRFVSRLNALLRPGQAERELAREIRAHLNVLENEYRHRGLSEEEAQVSARRALGGVDQTKEIHRDQRSFPWLEDLRRDVPYALRGWTRYPGFTAAAIVTIGLGVGVSTAIFSVVNAIVLRPLPYRDSDRLVQIAENIVRPTTRGPQYSQRFGMTQLEFLDWRAQSTSFAYLAASANLMSGQLSTPEGPVAAPRALVSPALFEMLGVPAQLGRTLIADDERANSDAAVISASAWQQFFGSDPSVLGRRITLNNASFTVVGVMPAGFDYPEAATMFWTVMAPRPGPGTNAFGNTIALLKPGVSIETATAEANAIGDAVRPPPPQQAGFGVGAPPPPAPTATRGGQLANDLDLANRPRFEVLRVKDQIVDPIRLQMHVLSAAVLVVLLITCANVANLLLARGTVRQREIGVRLAIGAGRGRIVRQLLTESLLLGLSGGLLGLIVTFGGVALIQRLATVDTPRLFQLSINLGSGSLLPRVSELGVDATTLIAALAIATIAGLAFGLVPALHVSRTNAAAAVSTGTTRSGTSPAGQRVRHLLVMAQVTLAALLLVGAGLLVRTFVKLQAVETGYDATNLMTFQLVFPPPPPASERQRDIIERVIDGLRSDSRVIAAGYTNIAPFLSLTESFGLFVPAGSTREEMLNDPQRPQTRIVNHTYLTTIGSRMLAGRALRESDDGSHPFVFVVNRALVNRYFGGQYPIDTLVRVYRSPEYAEDWRIVGVVEDLVQARLDEEPFPIVYAEMRQILAAQQRMPKELQIGQGLSGFPTIAVRTRGEWQPVAAELRSLVHTIDSTMGVGSIADFESLRYGSLVRPRFYAVLVGLFAAIAAVIAAVGLYAVLAFAIVQRTHEIGVRMALGARRASVVAGVLRSGVVLAAIGVAVGLAGAAVLTRSLSTMLFGLTPLDIWTYAGVAATLIVVAAVASAVPARRATRVDPVVALRCE